MLSDSKFEIQNKQKTKIVIKHVDMSPQLVQISFTSSEVRHYIVTLNSIYCTHKLIQMKTDLVKTRRKIASHEGLLQVTRAYLTPVHHHHQHSFSFANHETLIRLVSFRWQTNDYLSEASTRKTKSSRDRVSASGKKYVEMLQRFITMQQIRLGMSRSACLLIAKLNQ